MCKSQTASAELSSEKRRKKTLCWSWRNFSSSRTSSGKFKRKRRLEAVFCVQFSELECRCVSCCRFLCFSGESLSLRIKRLKNLCILSSLSLSGENLCEKWKSGNGRSFSQILFQHVFRNSSVRFYTEQTFTKLSKLVLVWICICIIHPFEPLNFSNAITSLHRHSHWASTTAFHTADCVFCLTVGTGLTEQRHQLSRLILVLVRKLCIAHQTH